MTKELSVKEVASLMSMMGDVDTTDLSIPTLVMVQNTSSLLGNGVQAGHLLNKDTKQVVGGNGKPFTFVPLSMFKSHQHYKWLGGKQTWAGEELFNGTQFVREEIVDGVKVTHDLVYNFYVLDYSEIKNPMALPYLLKLKRTSAPEGKKLVTAMTLARQATVEPWSLVYNLDTVLKKGEKGPYFSAVLTPHMTDKKSTRLGAEDLNVARKWATTVLENQASLNAKKTSEVDADETDVSPKAQKLTEDQLTF